MWKKKKKIYNSFTLSSILQLTVVSRCLIFSVLSFSSHCWECHCILRAQAGLTLAANTKPYLLIFFLHVWLKSLRNRGPTVTKCCQAQHKHRVLWQCATDGCISTCTYGHVSLWKPLESSCKSRAFYEFQLEAVIRYCYACLRVLFLKMVRNSWPVILFFF